MIVAVCLLFSRWIEKIREEKFIYFANFLNMATLLTVILRHHVYPLREEDSHGTWRRHAAGHRGWGAELWKWGGWWRSAGCSMLWWAEQELRERTLAASERESSQTTGRKCSSQTKTDRFPLESFHSSRIMASKCPKCEKTVYFGKWWRFYLLQPSFQIYFWVMIPLDANRIDAFWDKLFRAF